MCFMTRQELLEWLRVLAAQWWRRSHALAPCFPVRTATKRTPSKSQSNVATSWNWRNLRLFIRLRIYMKDFSMNHSMNIKWLAVTCYDLLHLSDWRLWTFPNAFFESLGFQQRPCTDVSWLHRRTAAYSLSSFDFSFEVPVDPNAAVRPLFLWGAELSMHLHFQRIGNGILLRESLLQNQENPKKSEKIRKNPNKIRNKSEKINC